MGRFEQAGLGRNAQVNPATFSRTKAKKILSEGSKPMDSIQMGMGGGPIGPLAQAGLCNGNASYRAVILPAFADRMQQGAI